MYVAKAQDAVVLISTSLLRAEIGHSLASTSKRQQQRQHCRTSNRLKKRGRGDCGNADRFLSRTYSSADPTLGCSTSLDIYTNAATGVGFLDPSLTPIPIPKRQPLMQIQTKQSIANSGERHVAACQCVSPSFTLLSSPPAMARRSLSPIVGLLRLLSAELGASCAWLCCGQ